MAQTIFGLEIKESWVEQMSPQLSGLPDQSWTNPTTGAVDTAVVEKVLGISREVRRSEHVRVKVPTSLSMATKGRQFRLHALYDHLCRYTHQTSKKRPLWRSWDLIQLNTACPSWAGHNSEAVLKCQAATPELREDIIERIKAAFAPLEKNAAKSSAIGHGALSSKGIEIAALCGVAIICLERIQCWEQASEESRSAIAALVFSISTLLGREFLAAAFGVCEGMDRYFSACLAAWEVERNPPAVEKPLSTGSVDTLADDGGLLDGPENAEVCPDLPDGMSLAQLYETVHKIAVMATGDSSNLLYIEQLEALIALNLPRIKESHSISEDATREVLTSCIAVIEKIGRTAIPGTFADEDFVYALNTAWLKHFDNLLCSAEANNATLTNAIETLIDSASDKLARLSKDKELRVEGEQQILSVAAAIVSAGFRERRELNAKKLELEAAMSTLRLSESISEEALIDALLPEWCPSADLMDGHDVELSLTAYTEGSRKALRGWHQQGEAVSQFAKVAFRNVDLAASAQSEEAEVEHSPNIKADGLVEITASVFSEPPPSSQASECIEAALLDENKQPLAVDPHSTEIATADEQQPDNASVIVQADELQVAPQSYEETAEWEEDDSPSDLITPGTPDVGLNHFLDIKGQATQRLIGCLNNGLNNYPAAVADNIAMHWLNEGQIPLAIKTLESASQIGAECYSLPIPLLSAAYHGMHVWRSDTSSVTRILRSMKGLSPEEIDYWMERRPGGRAIPYFVLAASLQPVMFAGNMTNAPRLLASMSSSYPDALRRLVDDLVKFTDRNHRLDLETLRSLPRSAESERRRDTTRKIEEWKDRIENKQAGWAPARNAMKNCLELPEFLLVISAIIRDDSSEQESVRSFTGKYRTHESQAALMSEQIARVLSEHYSSADIAGNARNWFLRTLDEVVSIADEWLESHESSHVQTGEVAKFARRFITQATTVVSTLTDELKGVSGLEKSVGLSIAIKTFRRILELADGQDWHRWEPRQIAGWLSWPREHLMEAGDDKPEQQLLSLCYMLEDGLDAEALARLALQNNNFRHAMLLTLHRQRDLNQDVGDTVAAIQLRFADYVHECGQRCQALTTLLDNAHVASLIDDQRHYQLRSEIDHIEEDLSRVEALDDMNATHLNLIELEADIKDKFDIKILEISTKLSELLGRARVEKGAGWVTQRWEEQFKSALDAKDTTIAEEMLEHLTNSLDNGKPLDEATEVAGPMFRELLNWTPILYPDLLTLHNPREVARTLGGIPKTAALAIQAMAPEDRSAIEGLIALRKAGVKTLDQSHYEMVINVFQGLGLDPVYKQYTAAMPRVCGFNTYGKFARMMLPVTSLETIRGIVFFTQEQLAREQMINVVVAGGEWNVRALGTMLSEQSFGHSDRTILLSGKPLSSEERNEFNTLCKQVRHTIYHVDPLLLTLLIGLPNGGDIRLKRFLQLSLPWTFANPYVGRQMQPAPVEMRYGRKDDLRQLLTMRNGAAIIFGGRQLGKTTLLSEAKRQFHNPIGRQHAYIQGMDGDMDRSELSRNRHEVATTKVWDTIFRSAVNAGLLEEPGSGTTTAEKIQRLRDYFQRDTAHSLMICLDEIDPILALDAANNFSIFREIRALMNESNGHFKVIIAGLENVRRFADAPNYPLTQMGSAIQVSIMNPPDALQLIREPLAYLGYEFESPLLMNRILVETNRHPGLIHIFCHELVKAKAANAKGKVGNVLITQSDIDLIRKDEAIHDIICERFDITLNLDQRYKLIAYSLINEGASSFSPSRAKSIVSYWAPETFSRMTEAQFEAFLDELCGLGILNKVRRIEGGKEYALRNSNILNLVGGRKKIEEKLLKAVEEIKDEDPMSGHAFPDGALRPSPLTIRDEKMIISEEEEKETREKPHRLARASNYSVGIIAGSEALGLRSQWLTESLPAIGLEERPLLDSKPMKYSAFQKNDTEFKTSDEFRSYLIEGPLHQAKHHPLMLFIELTGMRPLSFTLDLLDIAQELRAGASGKRHRVRVLFLMGPTVLWQWVSNPRLTAAREQMQPFADLDIWKRTALIHLINKVGLDNTSSSLDMLQQYSQGWYYSIDRLLAAVSSKPDMKMIDGFGAAYSPLLSAKQRSLGEFLTLAGLPTDSWGRQVLASLCSQDSFDLEDFELQLIELDLQIDPTIAIAWLVRLRLIHPVNKAGKNGIYTICETVRTGLKVLVA